MPTILGLVRRVKNRTEMTNFYRLLGLSLVEHQHGGPVHMEVSPVSPGFVFEVYERSERYSTDALMIGVEDLKATLQLLQQNGFEAPAINEKNFVYVKDPDGVDVMLVQL
jgi:hypothetical protein